MLLLINTLLAAEVFRLAVDRSLGPTTDIGMASHPDPKSVFIAGLGSGRNAGVAGAYPGVEVEAVEISDAVIDALPYFDEFPYNASTNERVNVIYGDVRHYLQTTDRKYDLILPDVYISALTGTAYLYNVEFFQLCAARLNEGGRVTLNVDLGVEIDRVITAGFVEAFEHIELLFVPSLGWYYLVASNDPISFPEAPLERWQDDEIVRRRQLQLGVQSMNQLRHLDKAGLIQALGDTRPSTDDHPKIDYIHMMEDKRQAVVW